VTTKEESNLVKEEDQIHSEMDQQSLSSLKLEIVKSEENFD
jgi:hypothetical protein